MEPPAAAVSPDPTPQEHSSPAKRSPWKHTAPNGVVEPGVMDANHWPALSETAKATTKPAPAPDSSSRPPDSAPAPVASSAVANSSNSQKHSHHGRHKPARRGGASGGDHSPRDHPDRNTGGWDHGGGGRGGQRNHNNGGGRRGNGGSGSGGGGASHHGGGGGGFGGRRRGGYDGFYHGPPPMGMGPYMRGAPPPPPPMAVPPPFMGPPPPPVSPMRAFAGPMVFHEMPSPVSPVSPMYYFGPPPPPEALRGMALAPPMGPPAYPYFQAPHEMQPEPEADAEENQAKLLKQIEFYFSKDNLCTDVFLRRKMDDQGWVDISLIAGFKKVRELTNDIQFIKETIQSSSILEIQDDKIRRQNDWDKWVIPRESNPDVPSSSASLTSRTEVSDLTAHLGGVDLHESASSSGMVDAHEVLQNGSPSTNDQGPVVEDNSGHQ